MKKTGVLFILLVLTSTSFAQKSKVQSAWRALSDYESTVKDGKPELSYLNKAKESVNIALANDETKNSGKAYGYKARIMYAFYTYNLTQELKKIELTVKDKKEAVELAYGNTPTADFEAASDAIDKIKDVDAKYMKIIQDGFIKGPADLGEEDAKLVVVATQIKMEASNIAGGKYRAKKFDEAADYFYRVANLNMSLTGKKDTANMYNACVSAGKSKNGVKILEYNKKMIDLEIASPYNFQSVYSAYLSNKDTTTALDILKKGRSTFPDNIDLLNTETNLFLQKGKQQEAISNIDAALAKEPNNVLYHIVRGDIYKEMAFPKDKVTGKDLERPSNFEDLFAKAEADYLKIVELKPSNQDYMHHGLFGLGAMYNNNGGYYQSKSQNLALTELKTKGKEYEAKYMEQFKKAIPYLEQSLAIKSDDRDCMLALRKLYNFTGDQAKAAEMNNRIKAQK